MGSIFPCNIVVLVKRYLTIYPNDWSAEFNYIVCNDILCSTVLFQKCCRLLDGQMIMLGTVTAITQGIFEAFARTQTMMFMGKYSLSLCSLLANKSISKSQQRRNVFSFQCHLLDLEWLWPQPCTERYFPR